MHHAPANTYDLPASTDFGKENTISAVDEHGKPIRYVLLADGKVAKIREGKGQDVERATVISGGDQSKYLTAMMSSTIEIEGRGVVMEDLGELGMKDYMRLQVAFADLNF
jgi:hypothetical protein